MIINIIFLILGCLMEGNCIIVMMVPLMLNLINAYEIDLLQFGILAALNIYVGCITPPVGVSLLVSFLKHFIANPASRKRYHFCIGAGEGYSSPVTARELLSVRLLLCCGRNIISVSLY